MTRALITGCSTGFGRATAVELTKRGYEVVATARRPETLEDLDVHSTVALDVLSEASVAAAVQAAGEVDVLVNNAGIGVSGPVESVPVAEAQRMMDTNFWGAVRMIQAVVPQMRERGSGAIVNVTSLAGRVVAPLGGFYAASKWALESIGEALYQELHPWGIRVVTIEPGFFDTPMTSGDKDVLFGVDAPPYDELDRTWEEASQRLQGGGDPPGPEVVAVAIADAVESSEDRLRYPVGDDAELVTRTRDSMGYEEFYASMKELLGIEW